MQETHFVCVVDCRVLENDFVVFSAYGSRSSAWVSLLIRRSFDADVDVVFAGDKGRLVVADVAVKKFQVPGGRGSYAQYRCGEGFLFSSVGAVPILSETASFNG